MMMYLATLICFCLSAVTAVKHYGMMPPDDMYGMIEDHAQKLLENDMRLVSIFTTDQGCWLALIAQRPEQAMKEIED